MPYSCSLVSFSFQKLKMAPEEGKVIPVRVAVRLRPLSAKEMREGCQECIDVISDSPQVIYLPLFFWFCS